MMKSRIKLYVICMVVWAICLIGCGRQEEVDGYQEIKIETGQISNGADGVDTSGMEEYVCLGTQFYQGERVQLWGERKQEGGSVYLHREDGSRELILEKTHSYFLNAMRWWLDEEGRCYVIMKNNEIIRPDIKSALWTDNAFQAYEGIVFRNELETEEIIMDICQLENGRIIVLVNSTAGDTKLAELDSDSGRMDTVQSISGKGGYLIAAEGNQILILANDGIWDCSLDNGKVSSRLSFSGTAYRLKDNNYSFEDYLVKEDFRLLEDGRAELLWSDGTVESLSMEQVNNEKKIITFRTAYASPWMKEQIVRFNQENEKYYIAIEEAGDSDLQVFRERTDMELGTGTGADIISSYAVNDAYSLLEKGVFADLLPFMEAAGIRETDYFPVAFSGWRYGDKVYGANYTAEVEGLCVDTAIAGEEGIHGIEDLADCLLAYHGDAVFRKYVDASDLLYFFLKYSESLCGMVDLENGTCDFSGELFGKLLEVAQRYRYEAGREEWICLAETRPYYTFYCFNDSRYLEQNGMTVTGYLFDEGGRTEARGNILAINANSSCKEGAWEFISFLLGEEVQSDFYTEESSAMLGQGENAGSFPVSRSAFEKLCESHLEVINGGRDNVLSDSVRDVMITGLTEARKEELRTALEEARSAPLQTQPLIQIILEEADAYFSGTKTIDEVRDLIENRVQLYLNERN